MKDIEISNFNLIFNDKKRVHEMNWEFTLKESDLKESVNSESLFYRIVAKNRLKSLSINELFSNGLDLSVDQIIQTLF